MLDDVASFGDQNRIVLPDDADTVTLALAFDINAEPISLS